MLRQSKQKLLLPLSICFIMLANVACSDDPAPLQNNSLAGTKWKLVKIIYPDPNLAIIDTVDLSENNIIYDFQTNDKLVITESIPGGIIPWKDLQAGEYVYYSQKSADTVNSEDLYLKINDQGWYLCSFGTPIDGSTYDMRTIRTEYDTIYVNSDMVVNVRHHCNKFFVKLK